MSHFSRPWALRASISSLLTLISLTVFVVWTTVAAAKPLHPDIALLDAQGENVLHSGQSVSTMQTCGQCHDTDYIAKHAFHVDLGLNSFGMSQEKWDGGLGYFGHWDPLSYRYLSRSGDELLDLSTSGWLMTRGDRVVGGGPATTSRKGSALLDVVPDATNPEASLLADDGSNLLWDWKASGTMEVNCFLCHIARPNLKARKQAIKDGSFGAANTATLEGLGIVERAPDGKDWNWNSAAFLATDLLDSQKLGIQDPTNENCAACHGLAHQGARGAPLQVSACDPSQPQTALTGQVISGQRMHLSGMNLADKNTLNRPWDIHAERQLKCTDCHHSRNNPAHARGVLSNRASKHLLYDPRTVDIGDYLIKPDHDFARGPGANSASKAGHDEMRRCTNCHDADASHASWLPYVQTHMSTVACESCHIPHQHAPAIASYDWTVLTANAEPVKTCRGIQGDPGDMRSLVDGFTPVLISRESGQDRATSLAPYNLITSFYWIYNDSKGNTRPVRLQDLQMAYFGNTNGPDRVYLASIMEVFDADKNGQLDAKELRIDSSAKETAVAGRLKALGLNNPRMDGQVQPFAINHGVARGKFALGDCTACHGDNSLVQQGMELAGFAPVLPHMAPRGNATPKGLVQRADNGSLSYQPVPMADGLYLFGANRIAWVDVVGLLAFFGTLLGVLGHALFRFLTGRKNLHAPLETHPVHMYDAYRRFWHWLQATSIVLLLATGIVIHRPDLFSLISFPAMVTLHNVLTVLLTVNAALSLFYHLATERMREYLPRPHGFIDDSILQAKYYISGIFKGEPHPFEKLPNDRMNPIQKLTYFGVLNGLLPLQIITGALMWGIQYQPDLAEMVGGLQVLAPLHTLLAWLFATFIVGHVYLTTTGLTPLEGIRAMVTGVEEVEDHEDS